MSQVEIRQIPSPTNQGYVGAWFSTGYYGHFRAKPRPDLCQTFRELARPTPPRKFVERHNSEANKHMFSHHDNRLRFEADPLVRGTQPGFGRRKTDGHGRNKFDPLFIGSIDQEKYPNDNKISSYSYDFNRNSTSSQIFCENQSINSSILPDKSVYSTIYKHGQPDCEQAKKIRQETFRRYLGTQTRRLQIQRLEPNANVASCLVWNNGNKQNYPIIDTVRPIETTTTTINHSESPKRYGSSLSQNYQQNKIIPPRSAVTTIDGINTNNINDLISKYM